MTLRQKLFAAVSIGLMGLSFPSAFAASSCALQIALGEMIRNGVKVAHSLRLNLERVDNQCESGVFYLDNQPYVLFMKTERSLNYRAVATDAFRLAVSDVRGQVRAEFKFKLNRRPTDKSEGIPTLIFLPTKDGNSERVLVVSNSRVGVIDLKKAIRKSQIELQWIDDLLIQRDSSAPISAKLAGVEDPKITSELTLLRNQFLRDAGLHFVKGEQKLFVQGATTLFSVAVDLAGTIPKLLLQQAYGDVEGMFGSEDRRNLIRPVEEPQSAFPQSFEDFQAGGQTFSGAIRNDVASNWKLDIQSAGRITTMTSFDPGRSLKAVLPFEHNGQARILSLSYRSPGTDFALETRPIALADHVIRSGEARTAEQSSLKLDTYRTPSFDWGPDWVRILSIGGRPYAVTLTQITNPHLLESEGHAILKVYGLPDLGVLETIKFGPNGYRGLLPDEFTQLVLPILEIEDQTKRR